MILPHHHILASGIAGAGKGLFLTQAVSAGCIIIAPDQIDRTYALEELRARVDAASLEPSIVRWFGDRYTANPDWPDECYVNHSFDPSGLWHLGFVFARQDLAAGTEVTVDYRHLLPPGEQEVFRDQDSGREIVGFSWRESLSRSTTELAQLLL